MVESSESIPATLDGVAELPDIVMDAGANARFAFEEFFSGLDSEHTVRAYRHAVRRFLAWCHIRPLRLAEILPGHVSEYIKGLQRLDVEQGVSESASKPTKKLHLAAIRRFMDKLVERHAIPLNVALSVRGPRHSATMGKTLPLRPKDASAVYAAIDLSPRRLGCATEPSSPRSSTPGHAWAAS